MLSEDFRNNHHRYWGKLYKPEDVKVMPLKRYCNNHANNLIKGYMAYPK